jgi:ribulose-phosphate 3-epimerase
MQTVLASSPGFFFAAPTTGREGAESVKANLKSAETAGVSAGFACYNFRASPSDFALQRLLLIELAPSILSADFARLGEDARAALEAGAQLLHVDVMDGHFVPNITIGPPVVASLRKAVSAPLDVHLMIENPGEFIPAFADAGADWISVHQEACRHLNGTLEVIKRQGLKAGVVINPATPVQTLGEVLDIIDYVLVMSVNPGFGGQKFIPGALEKVRKLATMRNAKGLSYRIEIDGGVSLNNVADIARAGAEILVAGNAVFGKGDVKDNVKNLLKAANEAMLLKA